MDPDEAACHCFCLQWRIAEDGLAAYTKEDFFKFYGQTGQLSVVPSSGTSMRPEQIDMWHVARRRLGRTEALRSQRGRG